MDLNDGTIRHGVGGIANAVVSRRAMVTVSGLTFLALARGEVFGQEGVDYERLKEAEERAAQAAREAARRGAEATLRERAGAQERAFFDRMQDSDAQSRAKMMQDWQFQRTLERLRGDLGVSDEEWKVIQPRIAAVYDLRHPPGSFAQEDVSASAMVLRLTRELRELVMNNKDAKPEEIKAKLTALRAAKERVRQELANAQKDLRQILTLRQEAILVLNGLLD